MYKIFKASPWAWMVVILLSCSCSGTSGLSHPQARVLGVSVTQRSQEGVRLEMAVEIENPNRVPLPLIESTYTLTVDNAGSSAFSDRLFRTLPATRRSRGQATGRQVIHLPVAYPWQGNDLIGAAYRVEGAVSYRPPGEIRMLLSEAKLPLPQTTFSGTGQIQ